MTSSVMPSASRSCLASPPILVNGSTAIEGLSGNGSGVLVVAANDCVAVGGGGCQGHANSATTREQITMPSCTERSNGAFLRIGAAEPHPVRLNGDRNVL